MGQITLKLLQKRAEHNEGVLRTLTEIALHQQYIERIELINQACRNLRILYLQNNLISKIENLHRLKDLQYLNLAVNNITRIENLERCESLRKLDLTLNFIDIVNLPSAASLQPCEYLQDLILLGNPCTKWHGYRQYLVALLPQLKTLDSEEITKEERTLAESKFAYLHGLLIKEGAKTDPTTNNKTSSPPPPLESNTPSPWCPETRLREQKEYERLEQQANNHKHPSTNTASLIPNTFDDNNNINHLHGRPPKKLYTTFPELDDESTALQCNHGDFDFSLNESDDKQALILEIKLGRAIDTFDIQLDILPTLARVLVSGLLLQVRLPQEVKLGGVVAKRSVATGKLIVEMPLERGVVVVSSKYNMAERCNKFGRLVKNNDGRGIGGEGKLTKASVVAAAFPETELEDIDDDLPPPL